MEDLIESLTRENPAEVKTVLATVTLALAVYQLVLIGLRFYKPHRANGDTVVVLLLLIALACASVYGWEDDYLLHGVAGAALIGMLAFKIAVVRKGLGLSKLLPVFGITVFTLLALTWATSAPDLL